MSLEIRNVFKSFGEKEIFDNFSFSFEETGIYAITGKSGIGKTTLLRLICGLDGDFRGEIIGGGTARSAVAFQEYRLFPTLTALENVVLANNDKMTPEEVDKARETLLNLGFTESELYFTPNKLSGGMKQRVSLARAILRKSPILLLDEPTKELNNELSDKVLRLLREEAKTRLVIFVTHKDDDVTATEAVRISI